MSKMKMASPSKLAENIEQNESYHQTFCESKEIFREFIGLLLLRLVAGQAEPSDWQVFDQLLRLRWRVRRAPESCQTPLLRGFEAVESTNSERGYIG